MKHLALKDWKQLLLVAVGFVASWSQLIAEEVEAQAQETNSPPSLRMEVQYTTNGVNNRSRHVLIFAGANRYSFFVPDDYRPDIAADNQVRLISKDSSAFVVVTLEPVMGDGVPSAEALQSTVLSHHSEVVLNKEHTLWLNQKPAPTVDFTWKTSQGVARMSRELVCASPIGVIRINLTASPERFDRCCIDLDQVLSTFSPGINGRFGFLTASKWP